jgi:hypothetical protein
LQAKPPSLSHCRSALWVAGESHSSVDMWRSIAAKRVGCSLPDRLSSLPLPPAQCDSCSFTLRA